MAGRLTAILAAAAVAAALSLPAGAGGRVAGAAGDDVTIMCLNKAGSKYLRKSEPVHCAAFGPNGSFAGGVNLKKLDWRLWGKAKARARGRECGFHLPCSSTKARVSAFRIRTACGRRVYTRLKSTSGGDTTTVKLKRCPGRA